MCARSLYCPAAGSQESRVMRPRSGGRGMERCGCKEALDKQMACARLRCEPFATGGHRFTVIVISSELQTSSSGRIGMCVDFYNKKTHRFQII